MTLRSVTSLAMAPRRRRRHASSWHDRAHRMKGRRALMAAAARAAMRPAICRGWAVGSMEHRAGRRDLDAAVADPSGRRLRVPRRREL